ncbi:MAG: DHH family phosphoesterase [Oscillospiraceae bacterium]|nr:DHH family phosphoesterase [Oscillospiraceae bacterium]
MNSKNPKFKTGLRKYIIDHKISLCLIVNIICFICIAFIVFYFEKAGRISKESADSIGISAVIIAFVNILIYLIIMSFGKSRKKKGAKIGDLEDIKPILDNITLDLIYNFKFPIIISDSEGYIIWYNEAVEDFLQWRENESDILKKSISSISHNQLSIEKFHESPDFSSGLSGSDSGNSKDKESDGIHADYSQHDSNYVKISINDKYYRVTRHEINIDVNTADSPNTANNASAVYKMNMFVFFDVTELEKNKIESEMEDPVVAYFMIDNLDEATQKMPEKYRIASGAVSDLLNNFMEDCGGILKEYDKDKYLCIFENRTLKNFIKTKFSILDSVRAIKIEELSMPVTISGGVSNIRGSFFEKELTARHALDLALQRGGDQVVLKGVSSTEFFGGKTRTVQKKTKVRSRVTANQLADCMRKSSCVLIMGHKAADNDSIGACVGIARFAMSINCKVNIVVNIHDPNIKSAFNKLRGIVEYNDIFIDETAALDKITADTLVVAVDVNNPSIFESEAIFKNAYKSAIIDHHRKIREYTKEPDIEYIEPSASSASELVAEILEQSLAPGELLKEEAELLLAGIFLDTQNFSRNTGTRTFAAALYLRGEGANPSDALALFKTNVNEFTKEAQFESNTMIYRNIIAISIFEDKASVADKTAGAKAADRMLSIDGIAASFVIFTINDEVNISARSLGKINVQIILEAFGGGGHFDVAGAQIKNSSLKDVLIMLKKTIDQYFDVN